MNVYAFSGAPGQVSEGSTSHHELGTAVDGDEDLHGLQAGGTWSVTFRTDTGVSVTPPRNVANSTIWNRVNYRDAEYVCESGIISWTDYRRVPVSVFDYLTADWTYAGTRNTASRSALRTALQQGWAGQLLRSGYPGIVVTVSPQGSHARATSAAIVLSAWLAAAAIAGCSDASNIPAWMRGPVSLVVLPPHMQRVSIYMEHVRTGTPVSIGGITLCLDHPGAATVTSIGLTHGGGMTVTHFAVRRLDTIGRASSLLGSLRESLAEFGFHGGRTLTRPCVRPPRSGNLYELGVEVRRTGAAPGVTRSLIVNYVSHGYRGSLSVPMKVGLCPGLIAARANGDDMCA